MSSYEDEEEVEEEEDRHISPYEHPSYEPLHYKPKAIQSALEEAVAKLWHQGSAVECPVELVILAGHNDCNLTDDMEPPDERVFLLLKGKGVRHRYCGVECDIAMVPFEPAIAPLEAWTVAKARHALNLPTTTAQPRWMLGCLSISIFG